jgi:transposase
MTIHPDVVGIDVSKHHLDVFDAALDRGERVANTREQVQALAARWAALGRFVVFEATGRYDRFLRQELAAAGVAHARINPSQARAFARAAGFLAKTDRLDARMLAVLGAALRPRAAEPADPSRERLALLHKRRDQLDEAGLIDGLDAHLAWLDAAVADLDRNIADLITSVPDLRRAQAFIRSIPGVGPVTAATLIALLPELGQRSPKTIAALAGLAPFNHDSGKLRGQRAIRGGRKRVRDALYMAAVAASRSNSRFKAAYQTLRNAGKPPKLAFIAIARKLLVTANALLRDQLSFQP